MSHPPHRVSHSHASRRSEQVIRKRVRPKTKKHCKRKNVGWYQFTQAWFKLIKCTRATRTTRYGLEVGTKNESDKDTFCWVWIQFLLFLLVDYLVLRYGVSSFTEIISMLSMVSLFWSFYLARHALFSLFHFLDGLALINIILGFWNSTFHFALLYSLHNYFSAFSPSPIQHKYFLISPMLCTLRSTVRT